MLLLLATLMTAPTQAACAASVGDLEQQAAAAMAAYERLEVERFQALAQELDELVPCLTEPATPEAAGSLHLVAALDAWTRRDEDQVHAALRALLALNPDYVPSVVVAPEGGGLAAAFEQARWAGSGEELSLVGFELVVDGHRGSAVPMERAALVQWTQPSGQLESRYAWVGLTSAELRYAAGLGSGPGELPSQSVEQRHRSRGLTLAAAGLGLVSALGARQANHAWSSFHATDSLSEAQRYYSQNRAYALGSGVAAAGAAGLALGAVVVWEW